VTFKAPRTSDGVPNYSHLEDVAPLHVTPLHIQFRKQGEPTTIWNETHGIPSPEIEPPSPPIEPSN
jgi:hypothetical protein